MASGAIEACSASSPVEQTNAGAAALATMVSGALVGLAGKCLDASGGGTANGTVVQLWECNGTVAQQWTLSGTQLLGPGGKCLDATDASSANGTRLQLWDCSGGGNQQWSFTAANEIVGIGGKCVDVWSADEDDGTPVELWDCWGGENQQWVWNGAVAAPAPGGGASGTGTGTTAAGATLPSGWSLKVSDHFGTGSDASVSTLSQLHAKYYEGPYFNRDANGLVLSPNVVINDEQETYVHFEDAIVFAPDHLTIQARGHADGTITSGELVSVYTARSFCVEGRYRIPSADKSWPAFWVYGSDFGSDASELDFEQPITPTQGVNDVSMYNHPGQQSLVIVDPRFTTTWMTWTNPSFDGSAAPHSYTSCYDDGAQTITRSIDGQEIYTASFQWNASLGGTGHGPDANVIFNLAVGGDWPGNVADPSSYSADLDLYAIDYYGPEAR